MQNHPDILNLTAGPLTCALCPRVGGSIARLVLDTAAGPVDLLRPTPDRALPEGSFGGGTADQFASFPLVPFSNRIAQGRFTFDGRPVRLPCPPPHAPHAIHGHGWAAPWRLDAADGRSARLVYSHPADSWPWRYTAVQTLALDPEGLSVGMEMTNDSDAPMPAGLGVHPYFPKPPGTRLTARAGSVWLNGPTILPERRAPVPPEWDFSTGATMDGVVIDNGFPGWDGTAVVSWPDRGLALTMRADPLFRHLIVYAPPGGDFMCVEPVSHMTDAVNRRDVPDSGFTVLAPGERLAGSVRLSVRPLA
ncbi:aldose 1-epimerase [Azospirillum sp. RWY-5-1]|uniref:Aldose 1-epimerase n=1 Tax=Azospirillum oleiclasticum TaxID=2735135 RepID=A0ABX2T7X9_9PROT|nr:aldose 1-epimerase [Azospirillum oleiclasticum]NYZ12168.1 aldose 1-epimerase [Azospirillum oleiclasticum]NYZ19328.1 aldose 1-epimerase [Azospirillum oleiclasticum]